MPRKTLTTLTLVIFIFLLCLLLLHSVGAQRRKPPVDPREPFPGPTPSTPNNCCGTKPPLKQIPNYSTSTYSSFTGQIAVATNSNDSAGVNSAAVVIWDLTNQATAPVGTQWDSSDTPPTNFYTHPDWSRAKIGEVFGLILDRSGNIYVATTRVYGTTYIGSNTIGPGSPGKGDIYKLDANTGSATRFVQTINANTYTSGNKIPNTGPGIGNIHYSCDYDKFYVTNFEDGMIYRIGPGSSGTILSRWDHGAHLPSAMPVAAQAPAINDTDNVGPNPAAPYTQRGRRPWAVQVYNGRLYYSVWWTNSSQPTGHANEIWSIGLDNAGDFVGQPVREVVLPNLLGQNFSNPVADISFSASGKMLLAERTMNGDANPWPPHQSRLLEYVWNGSSWQPSTSTFSLGASANNCAGGCDYDYGLGGRVWGTGDILDPNSGVYGLNGAPASGGMMANSILIDLDNNTASQDKRYIGDVEIPCYQCVAPAAPVIKPPDPACAANGQYCVTQVPGVTYTWNVTGGTPTTGTGSCINITWGSTSPKAVTVTATNAGGCKSTTTLELHDCTPPIDPCCPPWNQTIMSDMLSWDTPGSINAPYALHFVPTALFNSQMQAYINYLHLSNSAINAITVDWRLHDQGTGATCGFPPYGTQIGPTAYTTWTQGGSGNPAFTNPGFFNLPTTYPMVKGRWYLIHTGIYLENGQHFFPETCSNIDLCVRWQVTPSARGGNQPQILEVSDGKKIIRRIPMSKTPNR